MPFDFTTIGERLDALDDLEAGNARGRGLEDLAVELLESLPGVRLGQRNVLAGFGEGELDSTWINDSAEQGLDGFGRNFIVECKTSASALNSVGVAHFAGHAEDRGVRWSIIFALNGITGKEDTATAAQQVVHKYATRGNWIMVISRDELRGVRSADHLLAVIAAKQIGGFAKLTAVSLSAKVIAELDPNKGRAFNRGWEAFERAIRAEEERVIDEILDFPAASPSAAALAHAVAALNEVADDHRTWLADTKADPFMQGIRAGVLAVGAAFAALLPENLADDEMRRIVRFEARTSAPRRMGAHVGDELWELLTGYYTRKIAGAKSEHTTRSAVMAVLALALEEIIAIDNIEPADVFDDFDQFNDEQYA
jgi:hypothetical protein